MKTQPLILPSFKVGENEWQSVYLASKARVNEKRGFHTISKLGKENKPTDSFGTTLLPDAHATREASSASKVTPLETNA